MLYTVVLAFESFNLGEIGKILKKAFSRLSAHVTHKEHAFHLFTAGMLSILDEAKLCKLLNETCAGDGFADLLMSFERSNKTVIIEIKRAKSNTTRLAREGLVQRFEKKYLAQVPTRHTILAIGCAVTARNDIRMESIVLPPEAPRNDEEIIAILHRTWMKSNPKFHAKKKRID